ncbi:MAG: gliding motility-associated C-terminal domain-containing protein [Bacteroidetes bacterium]|nr:gliding motility-associated C-terminal domain-containing protein [Bacteroidota bacterium]
MSIKVCYPLLLISQLLFSQGGTWTWMHGDTVFNSAGSYGTKGVASATNSPPGLYEACEWVDRDGNFWLFGGIGINGFSMIEHNALWKFDPLTNMWTWVNGNSIPGVGGTYGTKGVAAATNQPGARGWGAMTWSDTINNILWMFGGYGHDKWGWNLPLNDLWKYDIATNEWTWMSGSDVGGTLGVWGPKGISAPGNSPPSKTENNATWVDSVGNLWLFGGISGNIVTNDMWKYDISTNEWTWINGQDVNTITAPIAPNYGIKGVEAPSNDPGSRYAYSKFTDGNYFYLFGAGKTSALDSVLNDLWRYNTTTNRWTWISGTKLVNDDGNTGNLCNSDTVFLPSAKFEQRASWSDNPCGLWIFGGYTNNGNEGYNDLWYYNLDNGAWTLVSGTSLSNPVGVFGTKGVGAITNVPGARGGALPFKAKDGSMWLFGGADFSAGLNYNNDLWKFELDTACISLCNKNKTVTTEEPQELLIPNVFSPNNDGVNDFYTLTTVGYSNFNLKIFNRWGVLVFESVDTTKHWDGKINGTEASDGTYYYILSVTDNSKNENKSYKGFLTLLR